MSDSIAAQDGGLPLDSTPAASAGAVLKQLRESAGVHIDVLAGSLKVPVAKLQALEDDDYSAFPDTVFMRGLASSICRTLKADAAPVLALLPQGAPIHLPPDRAHNTAFKGSGRRLGKARAIEQPKSRLVSIAVVGLLVAALMVAFLPLPMGGDGGDGGAGQGEGDSAAQPAVQAEPAEPPAPSTVAAGSDAPVAESALQQPGMPGVAASGAPEPTVGSAAPAAVGVEAAKAAEPEAVLVIRARAQTWVQVRNAAGQVVLQKELAAGDSYAAEGSPPWSVVIGRADAADAIVRGQAMDLKALARSNVARFEVK